MLAIKAVSQNSKDGGTIIFDEADTGVSGKVAESIGHVMKKNLKKTTSYLYYTFSSSRMFC